MIDGQEDRSSEAWPTDPLAAVTHHAPYPYYAHLVAEKPLYRDEALGLWVATSAAAVTAVLNHDLCRVRPAAEPVPKALQGSPAGEIFRQLVRMTDGRDRCPLKNAISASLAALEGAPAVAASREWADVLASRKGIGPAIDPDSVSSFAFELPSYVVLSLLGAPADHLAELAGWAADFAPCFSPVSSAGQIEAGKAAAGHLLEFFRSSMSSPAAEGNSGLLATMVQEARRFGRDDPDAVLANAIGFLFQAYEATAGLIGNTLLALASHREVRKEAEAAGGFSEVVQEVLRFDPSIQNTRRFLAGPATIEAQELRENDAILVVVAAANRDPAANPHPERFDVQRANRRLFTFGAGPHECPGQRLAATIATAGVERLLRAGVEPLRLAETVRYNRSANIRVPLFGRPGQQTS
jgi:cytochrome P450